MNWFKFLPFYLIVIFCLGYIIYNQNYLPSIKADPVSHKNNFLSQFNQAISTHQIKVDNLIYRDYQDEIEFKINFPTQTETQVIFSTQKDPFWQITSLQQILNHGKIKDNQINFIDLSIKHPYATLQNN